MIINTADCCDKIQVLGIGPACNAQSDVFTVYTIESCSLNERVHYTSRNGDKAVAFDDTGDWNIQSAAKRYQLNGVSNVSKPKKLIFHHLNFRGTSTSNAYTNDADECPNDTGITYKYYSSADGWQSAGGGLEVQCVRSASDKNYVLVESSDVTCKPVNTPADCESAAQQLGLSDNTVDNDGQNAKDYDPPYCYFESDELKFNCGTNTGPCTSSDKCLCIAGRIIVY